MIVRKIKPEELRSTNELFGIAFEFPVDNSKSAEEYYAEVTADKTSRGAKYCLEVWGAFTDDEKLLTSQIMVTPFPFRFDGNTCKMVGIGGVASLPSYRRHGGIRGCFEAALPAMYDEGVEFSYLYPFSTAYYRKFGYEMCVSYLRYTLKMSFIPSFANATGSCYLVDQTNTQRAHADIEAVHAVWQKRYNMMVDNESYEFAWIDKCNPCKDQKFTYVYVAADGTPKAYMTFGKVDEPTGRNLLCERARFVFADAEGFGGLMNLIRTLASDHAWFAFQVPDDVPVTPLLPEWSMGAGKIEVIPAGMVRVVNVEKVLQMARYKGAGRLKIGITDAQIAQNNDVFDLEFADGKCTSVKRTAEAADITMTIAEFSRLISGAWDGKDIAFLPAVQPAATLDYETLQKVFYKKPIMITEYF